MKQMKKIGIAIILGIAFCLGIFYTTPPQNHHQVEVSENAVVLESPSQAPQNALVPEKLVQATTPLSNLAEVQQKKEPTICLNMIVKDEAPVIQRCLQSVKPSIWLFCVKSEVVPFHEAIG